MPPYTLRRAIADDGAFLYRVSEVNFRGLVEGQGKKWATARMQEKCAQDAGSPSTSIIQIAGEDAGFVKVEVAAVAVLVDALLLLPEHQRRGVGTHVLRSILAQAAAASLPVQLSVYTANPARAFWEKHGFKVKGEVNQHLQMERET
ncbi:MAG TPA: GNAT family N-acetyltransferase [Burkholderiaceae bacterium]|nr:GNAT family N-acetyltransferase [Burkholderiaceae bacterium]